MQPFSFNSNNTKVPPYNPNFHPSAPNQKEVGFFEDKAICPATIEEQLAFLNGLDCFVLIDRSTSMKWKDGNGEKPWDLVKEYLAHIVNATIEFDKDGPEAAFFASDVQWIEDTIETTERVEEIFEKYQPKGSTNLTGALKSTFKKHFERIKKDLSQRSLVIVITDGKPNKEVDVKACLKEAATKLNQKGFIKSKQGKNTVITTHELAVLFFQVGTDKKCTEFLNDLDDNLKVRVSYNGKKHPLDFIDHKNIEVLESEDSIRECFVDAFYD